MRWREIRECYVKVLQEEKFIHENIIIVSLSIVDLCRLEESLAQMLARIYGRNEEKENREKSGRREGIPEGFAETLESEESYFSKLSDYGTGNFNILLRLHVATGCHVRNSVKK